MSPRFTISDTPIAGVKVLTRSPASDARGFLDRLFDLDELAAALDAPKVAQINYSLTRQPGTIRGMHYQEAPYRDTKLVTCIRGEIFDVAVDLRADSPTFLHWHAERLTPTNLKTMLIPHGCAHGFQTLAPDCELVYVHTGAYRPDAQGAVHSGDPRLAIAWPQPITMLSPKDAAVPMLTGDYAGIRP